MDIITVNDLTKHYKNVQAVNGVSFSIKEGEIFGFLGPNGAGKSTIIKMLTARLHPTSGEILINQLNPVTDQKKLRGLVGIVPEIQNLYERMSARENLNLFADLYGVSRDRVDILLKRFELYDRCHDKLKQFSFGMKQRILIARALLHEPRILFLDEPTKGLDPHTARYIREIIREEHQKGVTIFLTTHYMEEAEVLSDRVAIIDGGEIVALDRVDALKKEKQNTVIIFKDEREKQLLQLDIPEDRSKLTKWVEEDLILSINTRGESLEDLFIRLTGRSLV